MSTLELILCFSATMVLIIGSFGLCMHRIDKLEAQQKKDREDIAGFVNELIKNNRK